MEILKNKKYFVARLNSFKANRFTSQYHYCHRGFKKSTLNLGIFSNTNNELVGVLQWGTSAAPTIKLDRYVKEPIKREEYLELNRFCMADKEEKNSESQAISLGIKWIKKYRPDIRLLVSYAGRKEGNYGYIYQATNWEYLGYFISPGFWTLNGEEVHQLTVWNRYKRKCDQNKKFTEGICEVYDDVRRYWSKQFIYIQRLDKKLHCATEILPYPKPSTDFPIRTKEKVYKEGEIKPIENDTEKEIFYYDENEALKGKSRNKFIYVQYGIDGTLEKRSSVKSDIINETYLAVGVNKSIKNHTKYKNKYFRAYRLGEDIPLQIDVEILGWIDEIPFYTMPDIVKYTGLSRQGVQQSRARNGKMLGEKEIIWNIEKKSQD